MSEKKKKALRHIARGGSVGITITANTVYALQRAGFVKDAGDTVTPRWQITDAGRTALAAE